MNKTYKIKVPIYEDIIKVKIRKKIKKNYDAYVQIDKKDYIKLVIKPNTSHSTIAHEAVHICNLIFDRVHATLDINNDEPYAYLLGWVVEQINKVLNLPQR